MGDAQDRQKRLGNERVIHIARKELISMINLLTTPATGADGRPYMRGTKDKAERDQVLELLRQLGSDSYVLMDTWDAANEATADAPNDKEAVRMQREALKALPEVSFPHITVDAINYLRNKIFVDMSMTQTIQLGRLERRIIDAYNGEYTVPDTLPADIRAIYDAQHAPTEA